MIRRPVLNLFSLIPRRGAPPKLKKSRKSVPVFHAADRPAFPDDINFAALSLSYPPIYTPETVTKSGWAPAADSRPDYPFVVERTIVGNSLPVYTDIKNGRTKVITLLRRCGGDVQTLRDEMSKVCDNKEVRICTARLEVDGNYAMRVKKWLISLGF